MITCEIKWDKETVINDELRFLAKQQGTSVSDQQKKDAEKSFDELKEACDDCFNSFIEAINRFLSFRSASLVRHGILNLVIINLIYFMRNLGTSSEGVDAKSVNPAVIAATEALQDTDIKSPFIIMNILKRFRMPGVQSITFHCDDHSENTQRLEEFDFPPEQVPDSLRCCISSTIMTDPIALGRGVWIDKMNLPKLHGQNPFTRKLLPDDLSIDKKHQAIITQYVQKIEWIYANFSDGKTRQALFNDKGILKLLDGGTSFDEFCRVTRFKSSNYCRESGDVSTKSVIPPRYILDIFACCGINTLQPTKQQWELAIRRLCAFGRDTQLKDVLTSPYVKLMQVNVLAPGKTSGNAFDLIAMKQQSDTDAYARCRQLLHDYSDVPGEQAAAGSTPS